MGRPSDFTATQLTAFAVLALCLALWAGAASLFADYIVSMVPSGAWAEVFG